MNMVVKTVNLENAQDFGCLVVLGERLNADHLQQLYHSEVSKNVLNCRSELK